MQKMISWVLLVVMLVLGLGAGYAEDAGTAAAQFVMAGFDDESANHDWSTNLFFQRMQEKTGVSFAFEQYANETAWKQTKQTILAGGDDMPDVLFKAALSQDEQLQGHANGTLIDLRPYLEQYAPTLWAMLQENPDWLATISLPDGAIVALPLINQLQNNNAMWINKTWLDNLGLAMPTTAEELADVLRAFKTGDPNQNGKKDEIPMTFTGLWDLRFLGHAFGLVSNDYYITMDAQGQVSTILNTDENRTFLTWLHQLWTEGLLDDTGFSSLDSSRRITDSDATITYGMFLSPTPMNMVPADAMNDYALLQPLTYNGQQIYRDFAGDLVCGTFAITSACEDPATLISWVDYLYTEEGCYLMQAGQEGEDFVWNGDGTWEWVYDANTVASTVLTENTISDGGAAPGLASVDFQLRYDDSATRVVISDLVQLKSLCVTPYPTVWLDDATWSRVNELQMDLGLYAEQQMVWFVAGDIPLNDETWSDFCQTLEAKGLNEMLTIWQDAVK